MRKRGNVFVGLLCFSLAIFCLISIITTQMELTKSQKEEEELIEMVGKVQDEVDEMRYDLEREIDDQYIIEFAREKLGLHLPGETIFRYITKH
ncbi:MAG: septum formation initiator family protein [Clostridia bacterium]|nr:septum formation initiator family protein [Clostridia bacterium]